MINMTRENDHVGSSLNRRTILNREYSRVDEKLSTQHMQHPGLFLHTTSCDGSETRQDPADSQTLNAGARYVLAPHYFGPGRPMAGSVCLPFLCNVLIRFERVAVVELSVGNALLCY